MTLNYDTKCAILSECHISYMSVLYTVYMWQVWHCDKNSRSKIQYHKEPSQIDLHDSWTSLCTFLSFEHLCTELVWEKPTNLEYPEQKSCSVLLLEAPLETGTLCRMTSRAKLN